MQWYATTICFTASVIAGCTSPESHAPSSPIHEFNLPKINGFDSPHWLGTVSSDDPVVATVNGTKITQSMLERQLLLAGDGATPASVLDRMIAFELLARNAFEKGYYNEPTVGRILRSTMARRWVEHTFAEELRPETMPQSGIDEIFQQARGIYDHFTRFHVVDAQILCCTAVSDQDSCYRDILDTVPERREHLALCFEQVGPQVDELRTKLVEAKTTDEFIRQFETWSPDYIPDALRDTFQLVVAPDDYRFQYDINTTYEKQFEKVRYRVFYKEIMEGAKNTWLEINADTPILSQAIRSPIGFHILFIHQVDPERHLTSTDEVVKNDIRKNAFEAWRKAHFARTMANYCESVGCEVKRDGLLLLQEAEERQ